MPACRAATCRCSKAAAPRPMPQDVKDVVGSIAECMVGTRRLFRLHQRNLQQRVTSEPAITPATPFYGYTKGPGYYGKTFFIWPPDPRRPLNTGTATAWSTTATDAATINQFLQDFGYGSSTDLANAAFTTTLSAAISTTTATSITVSSSTPFPTSGLPQRRFVLVNSEIMIVTAVSGTTWTVQRGKSGTTAATTFVGSNGRSGDRGAPAGHLRQHHSPPAAKPGPGHRETAPRAPSPAPEQVSDHPGVHSRYAKRHRPFASDHGCGFPEDHAPLQLELCRRQHGDDRLRLADPLLRHQQ